MPRAEYITVANWEKFQHYKRRSPPWIRLYRDVIDTEEWRGLTGDAGKLLTELWLIASEPHPGGKIPYDLHGLCWKTGRDMSRPEALVPLLLELAQATFVSLPASVLASADASTVASTNASTDVSQSRAEDRGRGQRTTNVRPNGESDPAILMVDPVEWRLFEKHFRITHREPLDVALRQ